MSNASVVASIVNLLRRFELRELTASAVEGQLEDYVAALEGLRGEHLRAFRDTTTRLVEAAFADHDDAGENLNDVLADLRALLQKVPQ
jgi:hypothetical protein